MPDTTVRIETATDWRGCPLHTVHWFSSGGVPREEQWEDRWVRINEAELLKFGKSVGEALGPGHQVHLRDQLDEILGDREDYKALCRDHAVMTMALSENEAAARVLGIVEGDDFMLTIAQWAKSYRAPEPDVSDGKSAGEWKLLYLGLRQEMEGRDQADIEAVLFGVLVSFGELEDGTAIYQLNVPGECYRERIRELARRVSGAARPSPNLKEALSAALRSWKTQHATQKERGGKGLYHVLGDDHEEAEEELTRLIDHLAEAVAPLLRTTGDAQERLLLALEKENAQLRRAADRLSAAPGPPESADPPEGTGSKGGERDGKERRPTTDERIDSVWKTTSEMFGELNRRLIAASAAIQALELHRQGLTAGQAELVAKAKPSDALLRVIYHEVTGEALEDGLEAPALVAMKSVIAAPDTEAAAQILFEAGWAPTHPGRPDLLREYAEKIREMADV